MVSCTGIGINDFIAIGRALYVSPRTDSDYPKTSDDPKREVKRLEDAKKMAKTQLQKFYEKALKSLGEEDAMIFEMHQMMLDDDEFQEIIIDGIEQGFSAEHSVIVARDIFANMLANLDDDYLSKRADDVKDISLRLLDCLSNEVHEGDSHEDDVPVIICAEDLMPSQVVSMDLDSVQAIVLSKGSTNSHASILANSFGLASVVNLGDVFIQALKKDSVVIVDGKTGNVIIDPDTETLMEAQKKELAQREHRKKLQLLKGTKAQTVDGQVIELAANIGGPEDLSLVIENDADSVGLFRSEFVYLGCDDYPSEEKQFDIYKKVLEKMKGKRVVVRTLDIGSDKNAPYFKLDDEENPALGLRAIRLCFNRKNLLETQLKALYRASVYGKLAIMFPMIANV